jgi:DNA-binding NarL/FixJ family response regulator
VRGVAPVQNVLIVDDHPVVRLGLTLALERASGFAIAGEAGDVASAREKVAALRPNLVVLDLALGGRDGIELLGELVALHPPVRILAFSAWPEQTYARRVFQAGGHGYLMKDHGVEQVPAALFQEFAGGASRALAGVDAVRELSTRELQVLRLLGAGRGLGDIARELRLSVKTIGTHRERLKNKLGADNARELARVAEALVRAGRV